MWNQRLQSLVIQSLQTLTPYHQIRATLRSCILQLHPSWQFLPAQSVLRNKRRAGSRSALLPRDHVWPQDGRKTPRQRHPLRRWHPPPSLRARGSGVGRHSNRGRRRLRSPSQPARASDAPVRDEVIIHIDSPVITTAWTRVRAASAPATHRATRGIPSPWSSSPAV